MFLGGRDWIRAAAPGPLSYKPAKLQVGAGNTDSPGPAAQRQRRNQGVSVNRIQYKTSPLSTSRLLFILTVCCYCLHRETSGSCCTHLRGFQCFPLASGAAGEAKRWLFVLILLAVCNGNSQSLLQRDFQSLLQIWSFISPSEQRTDARLLHPWAGPLGEAASEAADLARKERTIYRRGRL